jgi:hypothetical protein
MAAVINTDEDPLRQISGPGFGEAWEALSLQRGCTEANRSRRSAVNFGSGDLGQASRRRAAHWPATSMEFPMR